jgi:23S rRNA (adenine1618-N6)-methyltransferase
MHPKNLHLARYNFKELVSGTPELKNYIIKNKFNNEESINFSDPVSVKILNRALLYSFYKIKNWDIPSGYLCPPIPGRADYIHYAADLLKGQKNINILDIGTGANGVYPLIGQALYGWKFVATDINISSIKNFEKIIVGNPHLKNFIELRLQPNPENIFVNIISPDDHFDLTICNPPFHSSAEEASIGTTRKNKNLGLKNKLNFEGQSNELWCDGGEEKFIKKMIKESVLFSKNCLWFSTLVSKKENLSGIYGELKRANTVEVKTFEMAQGQKISRIVAWTFRSNV